MKLNDVLIVIAVVAVLLYAYRSILRDPLLSAMFEGFKQGRCERKDIVFLDKQQTGKYLRADPEQYIEHMTPWDLYARNVKTSEQYIEQAANSARAFSVAQQEQYAKAAAAADAFFLKHGHEIIENMRWVFALTDGVSYENGYPHTRANIIFVSTNQDETLNELTETLVHEKLHLFQRAYPEKMAQLLDEAGYIRWKHRVGEPRIRANPDLDPWIYIDPQTKKPMAAYYASDKPSGISDIDVLPRNEHPFERMAYDLVKMV